MLIKALAAASALGLSSLWLHPAAQDDAVDQDGKYSVDPAHSSVLFKVQHLGAANFYGRFNEVSGTILVDRENPEDMMVRVKVPAASIDTNSEGRDEHLMGPDFFDAKQFPDLMFESTAIEAGDGASFSVTGELTLHGVTKEITFDAIHTGHGEMSERFGYRSGYEATITIQRSDYGISYMPGGLGEDVTLILALELTRS